MATFYGWGSNVSRLQNHYEEKVYFLLLTLFLLITLQCRFAAFIVNSELIQYIYLVLSLITLWRPFFVFIVQFERIQFI